jgi:A/G-specific adenine glycosylase
MRAENNTPENARTPTPAQAEKRTAAFRRALLAWYDANRRDLPWRHTSDAYSIWVSEIMLQQTRVAAVLEYYRRFLTKFPNVESLAKAGLPDILAAWSGLGYYRRARAMHAAAQVVLGRGGAFPKAPEQLRELPGIGRYTAAAIASIAFGHPSAVVDGNVERVLEQLRGRAMTKPEYWTRAEELLSRERPGAWNQAMMELGATVWTPVRPQCNTCPVRKWCVSKEALRESSPEVRSKKVLVYSLSRRRQSVLLVQRGAGESLMAGLWELPQAHDNGTKPLLKLRHSITNTDYSVTVIAAGENHLSNGKWVPLSKAELLPLTGLARKILRKLELTSPQG